MSLDFGDKRLPERFWTKVSIRNSGCWEWTASHSKTTGYGWYRLDGKSVNAHRVMCIATHGEPRPDRDKALHSCDNRVCVNPSHLRWGNSADNSNDMKERNRGRKATATHCKEGHEFTEDNTYTRPGGTTRQCRECHRRWWREWNERRQDPDYKPDRRARMRKDLS